MTLLLDAGGSPITAPSVGVVERAGEAIRDPFTRQMPVDDLTFAQWRKRLRMVSPHHDQLSYLHLVYEPGWPWEPVGRFMLFECIPSEFVDPAFLEDCQGTDPATLTTHDEITGEITQKTLVTGMQWQIYRETGRYARPFWVIQGVGGGHKVFLSDTEKKFLQLAGYPDTFPSPGELPYAPFDNRVIDQITRYDKLQKANGSVKRMAAMSATGSSLRSQALRREVTAWLGAQMDEAAKSLIHTLNAEDAGRDKAQLTPESRIEEQTEHYIQHGKFSDVR